MTPSLEFLYLSDIPTLVELPCSFQNLHQLETLKIWNCVNLETLPTGIDLQSLWMLDLSGCSRLRTFPDISTNIRFIYLSKTAIGEIPCWIDKFSRLMHLDVNGCNNLEYVNLKKIQDMYDLYVNFSECKALTGVSWSDSPTSEVLYFDFTKCYNLDQEALFRHNAHVGCKLWLSGEEVPSYFTHRATGTSSLTVSVLDTSLSKPFLRFRACTVLNCDYVSETVPMLRFTGWFWRCSDFYDEAQDFWAGTDGYEIFSNKDTTGLFIVDCQMSDIPVEMIFDHVVVQIHVIDSSDNGIEIKEWGIRILEDSSSADNRPLVIEAHECNTLNEAGEGEESAGEDEVTDPSSKRMRIS